MVDDADDDELTVEKPRELPETIFNRIPHDTTVKIIKPISE